MRDKINDKNHEANIDLFDEDELMELRKIFEEHDKARVSVSFHFKVCQFLTRTKFRTKFPMRVFGQIQMILKLRNGVI